MASDFNFPEYPPYQPSSLAANYPEGVSLHPVQPSAPVYSNPVSQQHQQPQQQQQQQPRHHAPFPQHQQQTVGEKRKSDAIATPAGPLSYEEASRIAAEEDKRRRNTAASARFRIKKKQREQALERTAKEMTEKVTVLEGRIQQLETENKWLKNMILEKNGGEQISSDKESSSKESNERSEASEKP